MNWRVLAIYESGGGVKRIVESAAMWRLRNPELAALDFEADELEWERRKRNPRFNGSLVRCSRVTCRQWKLASEFGWDKSRQAPKRYCKECCAELDRERRFARWYDRRTNLVPKH